jgi:lipopolysaccharide export system protein LptA
MYRVLKDTLYHSILLITVVMAPLPGWALQQDSKEKIYIVSDSTIYDSKTGFTIFQGHVKVDQGTTHIIADRLTTKTNPQHIVQEVIAYGGQELAHYSTLPKIGDPEIHANAKIIKFYPIDSSLTLEKNVIVTQGENSFHGELILYNRNDQTIIVPASSQGQAVLVYDPDKKSDL